MHVPFFHQINEYTCGPASLEMIFEYFGKHMTQEVLAKKLATNESIGTTHEKMIEVATKNGFYCYVNNHSTISEIRYFLSLNLPVIVHFMDPEGDPHYAIIVSHKNSCLVFNDPWSGKETRLSDVDFTKRWHDEKNVYKRWIMTLSKQEFSLGKQYFPTAV